MKKIYSISILIFILIFGLLCVSNKQIVKASGLEPCTIEKAVGHEDGCDDYCKALKDGNYNKDDEDVTDIICSTCGNSRT